MASFASALGGTAESTPLPAIDNDPVESPEQNEGTEVQDDTEGQEAAGVEEAEVETADDDQAEGEGEEEVNGFKLSDPLVQKWIKRAGLDPADPKDAKTLKSLLDQEQYIAKLKGGKGEEPEQGGALTEFERELLKQPGEQDQQAAAAAKNDGDAAAAGAPTELYNDVGKDWQSEADAFGALNEAWTEAAEKGDFRKVNAVDAAIFTRRFDAVGLPRVVAVVSEMLDRFAKQHLGDVIPAVRQNIEQTRRSNATEFAYQQLEKTPGFENVRDLTKEEDGQPVVINGQKFKNTPLNRILAANPDILDIRREHPDPEVADRLTYLARLRMVHRIYGSEQIQREKAGKLVKKGEQIAETAARKDRIRQGLNGGRGASSSLSSKRGAPSNGNEFIASLADPDEPRSFASL